MPSPSAPGQCTSTPLPRLLHGIEATTWPLLAEAAKRGHDARIGLEDSVLLPDGSSPSDNADMVRAARELLGL